MTFWGKIGGGVAGYVLGFAIGLKIDAFGWFEQAEVGALIGVLAGEVLDYWRDRRRERRSGGTGRWRWRRPAIAAIALAAAMYGLAIWPLSFRLDWKAARLGDAICTAARSGALATVQENHKFPGMNPLDRTYARALRAAGQYPNAPCDYEVTREGWGPTADRPNMPIDRLLVI